MGAPEQTRCTMDRRTFLIGLLGLGAASTIIAASASSVEAASLPEALSHSPEPLSEPTSVPGVSEADLKAVQADWAYYRRYYYRRRFYRPVYRRRYPRFFYRRSG